MDYHSLIEALPALLNDWELGAPGADSPAPAGLTKPRQLPPELLPLLHGAIAHLEPEEIYCVVGELDAPLLTVALRHRPDRLAYAVDTGDINLDSILQILIDEGMEQQVWLGQQTLESFFADLHGLASSDRIGLYLYRGASDYRSLLMALLLVQPFLADQALMMIQCPVQPAVQQAIWDFIASHPACDWWLQQSQSCISNLQILRWDVENPHNYDSATLSQMQQPDLIQAIAHLVPSEPLLESAQAFYHQGLTLEQVGDIVGAAQAYQQAIAINPDLIDAYTNLGNLVALHGDLHQAESIYRAAIAQAPNQPGNYLNLGNLLLVTNQIPEAITCYETALALNPASSDLHHNLALARQLAADSNQAGLFAAEYFYRQQRYTEAIAPLMRLVNQSPVAANIYGMLAHCQVEIKQYESAIATCQQGLARYPDQILLYTKLIKTLQEVGQTEQAIAQATIAIQHCPQEWLFHLQQALLTPILYQSMQQVTHYRQRFAQGLNHILQTLRLDTPTQWQQALTAVSQHTNFFLSYQGGNDRPLQEQYGQWIHQVMAANYPQWVQPITLPPITGKIRVGYVSGCLFDHTVGRLMLGWFRHADHSQFDLYAYHVLETQDAVTQEFQQYSHAYHYLPNDLEALCQQVLADRLHILVFPEIGMLPLMMQAAALRLAPVQCSTWVHPVTSGLPTIDYFLSSDLMEPEDAPTHYSEILIRLPNLGIAYAQPNIPPPTQPRSAFGLPDEAVLYLVSQTLCKILPDQDAIFAAIAQQVPSAQFIFIARPNDWIAAQFCERLDRAFAQVGLDSQQFCRMLSPQGRSEYWHLNQLCDVFLDTFAWSGGHTTLEAIACGLPVVTYPGQFMRGRHSYAILQRLEMRATIAANPVEYVEIAVRLAHEPEWRHHVLQTMRQRWGQLYGDLAGIRGLEAFYRQVLFATQKT